MVLALERFLAGTYLKSLITRKYFLNAISIAVSKPLAIYVGDGSGGKWRKVFYYVGPVLAFTLIFNLPYLFQFKCEEKEVCSRGKFNFFLIQQNKVI